MKKLLSIILACAMIMSLFCVVPASAAVYSNATLPYFFSDFENDTTVLPGATLTTDATHGGVAKIATTASSPTDIEINSSAYGQGAHLAYDFVAGDQLTVSFWLKLSKPLTEGAAMRVLFWDANTTYSAVNLYIPDYTSTDWQYVSLVQSMGAFNAVKANFRTGLNNNNVAADDSYEVDYYIDNFEMKVEHGTATSSWINSVTSSWTYYMEKNAAAAGRNVVTMAGPSGADVKVRQFQGGSDMAGVANQLYSSGGGGGQMATLNKGDEVRVTAWVHIDKVCESTPYYVLYFGGDHKVALENKVGWQRLDHTFVMESDYGQKQFLHAFGTNGTYVLNQSTLVKATDGTFPTYSYFNYNINTKRAEKANIVAHTSYQHSGSGSVAYWGNGMEIKGNGGISTTQHDGTTGTVSEIKANASGSFNQMYNANWAGCKFEHAIGDIISVSAWVKLPAVAAADTIYYTVFDLTESIVLPINGKSTDWQYIEGSMVASKDHANIYYHSYSTTGAGGYTDCNTANWPKDADGNYISIYVDDWAISVGTPSAAAAVYPVATAQPASMTASAITPNYTIVSKTGAAIADAAAVLKVVGQSGRVYATSYGATAPAVSADETLYLEITPIGNGYVGAPVTASIIDLSAYNGIEIVSADTGFAEISTDTALTNAKLIWVGYTDDTEHGCIEMTGTANIDVNMDAYSTQQFRDVEMDLGDFTFVKVFLWSDLTTAYAPLASLYEY